MTVFNGRSGRVGKRPVIAEPAGPAADLLSPLRVAQALAAAGGREAAIRLVLDRGVRACGASSGALALLDEDGARLQVAGATGADARLREAGASLPRSSRSPLAAAFRSARPRWIAAPDGGALGLFRLGPAHSPFGSLVLVFGPRADWRSRRAAAHIVALACERPLAPPVPQRRESPSSAPLLEDSRALAEALMAQAPLGLAVLDGSLRFESANSVFAELSGCAASEHKGRLREEVLGARWASPSPSELLSALSRNRAVTVDLPPGANSPEARHFLARYYAIRGEGRPLRIGLIAQDITERMGLERQRMALLAAERTARAEAERANLRKDEFLARVSHELRSPLATLQLWLEVVRSGRRRDRPTALHAIGQSVRAQSAMIEDLLDVARGVAGKLRVEVVPLDARTAVEAAALTLRAQAKAAGVRLYAPHDPLLAMIYADPTRLTQILTVLIGNAIKFTPSGGTVQVRIHHGAALSIVVSDSGRGMSAEFQKRIFTSFQQENARSGGLGLGLSIARQLALLQGGTLAAESEGEGRGSTFTLTLPAAAPSPGHAAAPKEEGSPLQGLLVLVVDDDGGMRDALALVLRGQGARAHTCGSGTEAFELLPSLKPDAVVCDIGMEEGDGLSLIRRVRQLEDEHLRTLPAVALTAYASPEDRRNALAAGFHEHLAKPASGSEILAAISRALSDR